MHFKELGPHFNINYQSEFFFNIFLPPLATPQKRAGFATGEQTWISLVQKIKNSVKQETKMLENDIPSIGTIPDAVNFFFA